MNEQAQEMKVSEMLAKLSPIYPKSYLEETARAAFEEMIGALYAQGGDIKETATVLDAAFMIFQLAQDPKPDNMATATINEYVPMLVSITHDPA